MNVNAHDLKFTLEVYKNMQVMYSLSFSLNTRIWLKIRILKVSLVLFIQKLGVMADMASYNILLKACYLAGNTGLAQEIYGEVKHLESKGVLKLDVFTYSTIVKVYLISHCSMCTSTVTHWSALTMTCFFSPFLGCLFSYRSDNSSSEALVQYFDLFIAFVLIPGLCRCKMVANGTKS